jgi:Fe-S oxidoreductase
VIEEPRRILKAVSSQFVEMNPHGVWNLCCGGGGGLAATADYGQKRIQVGKAKADQIRETGAKIVITNCYNCMTQIRELNKAYELGIEVKSIVELVAESLKT